MGRFLRKTAYEALDLSQLLTVTDGRNSAERFVIGCEPGLSTRFTRHLCDTVSNALETIPDSLISCSGRTRLPFLMIREKCQMLLSYPFQAARSFWWELKPYWTVLDNHPISAGQGANIPLQPHLGKPVFFHQNIDS